MNDEDRKLLTAFLDECWHDDIVPPSQNGRCSKCDMGLAVPRGCCVPLIGHRTFDTWQDLGDLKRKLEISKQWSIFLTFAFESDLDADGNSIEDLHESARSDGEKFYNPDFIGWLLNPKSFCQLVADYIKAMEAKE